MPLTDAFATLVAQAVKGEAPTYFDSTHAYLGVGDSNTAFVSSQTDLQAGSNFLRKAMDATYPTRTGAATTYRSTFATGDANFHWLEWGVFNASSAGTMESRKVEDLGTKTSAQSWQLTVTVTLSVV